MRIFFERELSLFFDERLGEMRSAVHQESADRILGDDHAEYVEELVGRFFVLPLKIDFDAIAITQREEMIPGERHPASSFDRGSMVGTSFPRQVIRYHIPYSGTEDLLWHIPNPRIMNTESVDLESGAICFDVINFYDDASQIRRDSDQIIGRIRAQSEHVRNNVNEFNDKLQGTIVDAIAERKSQLQSRSDVLAQLGLPVREISQADSMTTSAVERSTPTLDRRAARSDDEFEWDVFICHASDDKAAFVEQLVHELGTNYRVWYDDRTLMVGDSLRKSIDDGLVRSRYGIVILSPRFFGKQWPQQELDGLVTRERDGQKVILPVWLDVDFDEVAKFSPTLAGRMAAKASDGLQKVVEDLMKVLGKED